jgi:hypothetical protein
METIPYDIINSVKSGYPTNIIIYGIDKIIQPYIYFLCTKKDTIQFVQSDNHKEYMRDYDHSYKGCIFFENENYDVLKIEVEDKLLNEYFNQLKKLPNHSDYPEYNAHVTIAYLKSGLGKKYVEKNPDINLKVKSLVYSKPNGERINLVK